MKYKILEGIATADVAYEAYGETLEELFENSAEAVEQTMVDIATVSPSLNSKFKIQKEKLENLLLDFLNELIFYKDAQQLLFSSFKIKIDKPDTKRYTLDANIGGEKIDPQKHKLRCDVKAVARHHLEIKKEDNRYMATIVLDI